MMTESDDCTPIIMAVSCIILLGVIIGGMIVTSALEPDRNRVSEVKNYLENEGFEVIEIMEKHYGVEVEDREEFSLIAKNFDVSTIYYTQLSNPNIDIQGTDLIVKGSATIFECLNEHESHRTITPDWSDDC